MGSPAPRARRGRAPLPEVLEAPAELAAAQGDDRIGTRQGPVHPGALEAGADGHLATGFDDTRRDAQALGTELRVAHAARVARDVVEALARLVVGPGVDAQGIAQGVELPVIQLVVPLPGPLPAQVVGRSVDGLRDIAEMLLGVEQVHDPDGPGELLPGQVR